MGVPINQPPSIAKSPLLPSPPGMPSRLPMQPGVQNNLHTPHQTTYTTYSPDTSGIPNNIAPILAAHNLPINPNLLNPNLNMNPNLLSPPTTTTLNTYHNNNNNHTNTTTMNNNNSYLGAVDHSNYQYGYIKPVQ